MTLGAPVALLGVIEGVAEAVAVALRGIAGRLSDRIGGGRRVPWVASGYGLTSLSRPLLAAATSWPAVLAARLVDRTGKAVRTAPRDALIRESTPSRLLGASFGYHRAMDTAGAVVGPLAAVGLLAAGLSLRQTLWVAVVPGALTLLLIRLVQEAPTRVAPAPGVAEPAPAGRLADLPRRFWFATSVWVVFSIGNSSDAFLLLRAHDLGLGATLAVLAYASYNLVYAALSWPLGALSDRIPRQAVLGAGLAVFTLVYLGFAVAGSSWAVWPLFAVYGAYIAATDGVARAWVGDYVPPGLGGTAYGVFAAATGGALLVASVVAGQLWDHVSPRAPFLLGAASAGAALLLLALYYPTMRRAPM